MKTFTKAALVFAVYIFEIAILIIFFSFRKEFVAAYLSIFLFSIILAVLNLATKISITKNICAVIAIGIISFFVSLFFEYKADFVEQLLFWVKQSATYIFLTIYILFALLVNIPLLILNSK